MRNRLLLLLFAGLLMAASPLSSTASEMEFSAAEQLEDQIGITVEGQAVNITGAQGETLEVVSLTGRKLMSAKIETPAQRIELNIPKGCYILKVGKVVRKIQIR